MKERLSGGRVADNSAIAGPVHRDTSMTGRPFVRSAHRLLTKALEPARGGPRPHRVPVTNGAHRKAPGAGAGRTEAPARPSDKRHHPAYRADKASAELYEPNELAVLLYGVRHGFNEMPNGVSRIRCM